MVSPLIPVTRSPVVSGRTCSWVLKAACWHCPFYLIGNTGFLKIATRVVSVQTEELRTAC